MRQYLQRTEVKDGIYEDVSRGISFDCPLSLLMRALHLRRLDERLQATGLFYVRFMDARNAATVG